MARSRWPNVYACRNGEQPEGRGARALRIGLDALSAAEAPSVSTEEAVIQFPIERQPKGR